MTASKDPAKRQGNARTAKRHLAPVEVPSVDPSVPASLGSTGSEFWVELMRLGAEFYTETDRAALLDYCKMRDLEADLEYLVDSEGTTVKGSQNQDVLNPNMRLLMDVRKDIRSAGKDLALNPRDRVNLGMAVRASKSKMEEMRARREAEVADTGT